MATLKLMLLSDTEIIICYNYLMDRFLLAFLFQIMLVSITNTLEAKSGRISRVLHFHN